ncbi:hypothetical protein LJC28_02315 [Dysgonomonas sp. OttesenSCG-928-D17]|nr:hypothetical protein [Dysgonomonas sp. OttesenSCG-928-D17]
MKKIAFILLCIFVAIGCSTTKKATKTSESTQLSSESQESQHSSSEKFVDTTKTESGKITITEIEFYPPIANNESTGSNEKPKANNVLGLSLPNIGSMDNAAIKSIKQTTIESESESKGESNESSSTENIKSEAISENTEKTAKVDESPAPDPYRWRYIFYILLIGVAALLYFKRVPILNWIKTILSGVRKIF